MCAKGMYVHTGEVHRLYYGGHVLGVYMASLRSGLVK